MKTYLYAGIMIGALLVVPTFAATKCVSFGILIPCTTNTGGGTLDWSVTCTRDSVTTPIVGIAGCSSQDGGTQGMGAVSITTESDGDANSFCWCKMVSPAVSSWIFYKDAMTTGDCAYNCATDCANAITSNMRFKTALLNDLRD